MIGASRIVQPRRASSRLGAVKGKRSRLATLALTLLAGCELSRPEGAFVPDARTASPDQHGFGDAASPDDGPQHDDAGMAQNEPDTGIIMGDPGNPLSALTGWYLMRVDVYSTASASSLGNTLTLKSRVSNLMVAGLSLKADGTLTAHETLCTQSYYHECVSNCSGWRTDVDPGVPKQCMNRVIDRDYVVSPTGALQVGASAFAIGFNETDAPALPADQTDPRVWKLGTPDQARYGVNTHLTAQLGPLGTTMLDCYVGTAQRFSTSFAGKLDLKTYGKDALVQKPMLVDTSPSTAATIYVDGTPAQYCDKMTLKTTSQQTPDEISVVRFKRYGGVNCPTSTSGYEAAYEAAFPGVAQRPTAADLM
ncbi:MAG: hypothetical protein JWN04_4751 [Myxococcaceae bacterium]|nr:hypothetical protein [Myxococcaceae bacterium]